MEKNVEAIVFNKQLSVGMNSIMDAVMVEYFSNLRLLIIGYVGEYVNESGSLNCLSNELRYIEWLHYPFMYLPSSFQPIQLVELILRCSSIKQLWKGKKYLPNLRNLCLYDNDDLIEIPNFEEFPNLEQLNLAGCIKLVKLDPSIGLLNWPTEPSSLSNHRIPAVIRPMESISDLHKKARRWNSSLVTTASICKVKNLDHTQSYPLKRDRLLY
ncbi:disease resistance protein RUN1 [Trifolium repens]|nr:disease resistance protein RUN1 [Trifolium repens]